MSTYIRTGRGGAGNMITKDELKKKEAEIARESPAASAPPADVQTPPTADDYKHMGRGGAGNYFQPSELHQSARISPEPEVDNPATPEPPLKHTPGVRPWTGRGGAGNFVYEEPAKKEIEIELEERQRAREVDEEVRTSVEQELHRPTAAHVNMNGMRRLA